MKNCINTSYFYRIVCDQVIYAYIFFEKIPKSILSNKYKLDVENKTLLVLHVLLCMNEPWKKGIILTDKK